MGDPRALAERNDDDREVRADQREEQLRIGRGEPAPGATRQSGEPLPNRVLC